MDKTTELDLNKLEALAKAATPQKFDSAQITNQGWIECPSCDGSGEVELTADYCNYDGRAIGVQFYGIGPEHRAAEAFYRAASPAAILELIALARAGTAAPAAPAAYTKQQVHDAWACARKHNHSIPDDALDGMRDALYAILAAPAAAGQPSEQDAKLAAEVIGCFRAADIEGLTEAMAETTDERLKDLVERRLMYALYAAQEVESAATPEQSDTTKGQA